MEKATIGDLSVSRLCVGGNPFSGFAHQTKERANEMVAYYTPDRIKSTLRAAEDAGINTFFGRTDDHIMGILKNYWEEGGTIQWFAQICTEHNDDDAWRKWLPASVELGASAAYIHGGVVDQWFANGKYEFFHEAVKMMRGGGIAAGFAGHNPEAHKWIRDNLDVDFQMCSYYNPTDRSKVAHHSDTDEKWDYEDRRRMLEVIESIKTPVVHYKVFAAGNKPITEAFETMGKHMRKNDIACVGVFLKDDPEMIVKDIDLFERYVGVATPV